MAPRNKAAGWKEAAGAIASRKFVATAILVGLCLQIHDASTPETMVIDVAAMTAIALLGLAYAVGQGITDHGKEVGKAKPGALSGTYPSGDRWVVAPATFTSATDRGNEDGEAVPA